MAGIYLGDGKQSFRKRLGMCEAGKMYQGAQLSKDVKRFCRRQDY
jgi:hypothetical protein